jgi:hypothetical protein
LLTNLHCYHSYSIIPIKVLQILLLNDWICFQVKIKTIYKYFKKYFCYKTFNILIRLIIWLKLVLFDNVLILFQFYFLNWIFYFKITNEVIPQFQRASAKRRNDRLSFSFQFGLKLWNQFVGLGLLGRTITWCWVTHLILLVVWKRRFLLIGRTWNIICEKNWFC